MDELKLIIPLLLIALIFLSYARFSKLINPSSIIVLWWSGWLFVSNFSPTGLFVPSLYTQSLVLIMLIGFIMGCMIPYTPSKISFSSEYINNEFYSKCSKFYYLNIFIFPVMLFYLLRALNIFFTEGLLGYRNAVFEGDGSGASLLFEYGYIEYLFNLLISPMIFLSLVLSIVFYIFYNDKRYILISVLLVIMESVLRMGRFAFYNIIVLFLLSLIFLLQKYKSNKLLSTEYHKRIKKKIIKIVFIIVLMILSILLITHLRISNDNNFEEITKMFKTSIIETHIFGFTLLDSEITNSRSLLNSRLSYGRSTLGGIDDIIMIFMRRFDKDLTSIVRETGTERYEHVLVGYNENGFPTAANAYYTIVSSLYMDGREPFILIASTLFGFMLSIYYRRWLVNRYLSDLILSIYLTHMALFSIFMSPPEGSRFWLVLIVLITINIKQHRIVKNIPYRILRSDAKLLTLQTIYRKY